MSDKTIRACHLYGNLLNTYGDNGNMLMMEYAAKQKGVSFTSEIISIYEEFDPEKYDFVFFGGGQDYEQTIVSKDIQTKKEGITSYIEDNGVLLAICGGYQMLGHYYIGANGTKIQGISALDHYTLSQDNNRFIGEVKIHNDEFNETYVGFENHNGVTYLGEGEKPLGTVLEGDGNNGKDKGEGAIYKNTFCSYLHGPVLARNEHLAHRLVDLILDKKYNNA
ncbi:adenosylcobyric acid synthase [Vagococcus sp. PNs007]|uniref:Lipid II isoglutaminyl synthase (glutamine-hydrolyzing) subunit GatD n=1 Tax=Vagococcus proximus TaxID=2991417 RepID=A0ABT5X3H6_9ENTE|nr:adenosylcobyric acid synthase [Vagococcus proximus]MDF0480469.1 adenosylcobyric acid synthase [Vagococcus proximus]